MPGHIARIEEGKGVFEILTGNTTGQRPQGRPRRRWEDNITMDLEQIVTNAGNWVYSAQDRTYWRALVNAALNLRVHKPWSQLVSNGHERNAGTRFGRPRHFKRNKLKLELRAEYDAIRLQTC